VFKQCKSDEQQDSGTNQERQEWDGIYGRKNGTAPLPSGAKAARSRHQTYSEYVRQLIVQDVEPAQ